MSDEEAAPLIRKLERLGYTVLAPAKAGWSVVSTEDVYLPWGGSSLWITVDGFGELQVGGGPQDDTVAEWVQLLNADRVFASVCVASVVGGTRLRISSIQRRKVAVRSTAEGVEFEVEEDPPLAISTPLPRHVPWPLWGYE